MTFTFYLASVYRYNKHFLAYIWSSIMEPIYFDVMPYSDWGILDWVSCLFFISCVIFCSDHCPLSFSIPCCIDDTSDKYMDFDEIVWNSLRNEELLNLLQSKFNTFNEINAKMLQGGGI